MNPIATDTASPFLSDFEHGPSVQIVEIILRTLVQKRLYKTLSMEQPRRLVTEPAPRRLIDFSEENSEFTMEIGFGSGAVAVSPQPT